jgi:hypothetical protein
MFNSNFDITGIHANYLKDLCELRGNVADKEQHNNFKIFKSYIDAYIFCPLIGYQYSRKGKMGSAVDGDVGILAEQIIKRNGELKFVFQILMLIDEESEPDADKRVYRALISPEKENVDQKLIEDCMQIYNEYFLGGIEVLHEQFVEECVDRDQYLLLMYQFTKNFYEEQDGEALKTSIDKILNM